MTLPPKALQVLADLKKELLSKQEASVPMPTVPDKPKREPKPQTMRHARVKAGPWQKYCQHGGHW
jgi:hypothetical protein